MLSNAMFQQKYPCATKGLLYMFILGYYKIKTQRDEGFCRLETSLCHENVHTPSEQHTYLLFPLSLHNKSSAQHCIN